LNFLPCVFEQSKSAKHDLYFGAIFKYKEFFNASDVNTFLLKYLYMRVKFGRYHCWSYIEVQMTINVCRCYYFSRHVHLPSRVIKKRLDKISFQKNITHQSVTNYCLNTKICFDFKL